MDVLEWKSRSAYALTEFVVFMIGALIFAAMLSSLGLLFCHFRNSKKRRRRVKRLHRFLIKTVFSGGDKLVRILYPNERKESKQLLTVKTTRGKIAVHVYFTLLSGLVAFWYLTVFANTAIYRKTGHCHDLHVSDTDLSCFLVSDRNVPPESAGDHRRGRRRARQLSESASVSDDNAEHHLRLGGYMLRGATEPV